MADVFNRYFQNLQAIFEEVLKIKNSGADRKDELAQKRKYASLLFVLIKKINRMVKYKVRSGREDLHKEKLNVDSKRLHLQNLLYEVNHLKREVRYCHQFKSQDEDIDLLPESEYLAIIRPQPETKAISVHDKRLASLEWELSLRKQLSSYCKELLNSKKQVIQDIVLKMERLTSFAPSLRTLLKATRPLQDALQLSIDRDWKLHQLVQLLPQPLYLAYMNVHALEKADEFDVNVVVIGSEEDVHQIEYTTQAEQVGSNETGSALEESDSIVKKQRKGYNGNVNPFQEIRRRMLDPHPLSVRFTIGNAKESDEGIIINLRYFQQLGFVTASTEMNSGNDTADVVVLDEITSTQEILKYLYEDDYGETLPVSGAEYELRKIDMTTEEFLQYLNVKGYGKPYNWLQRLCCIEVFDRNKAQEIDVKLQKLIPEIIRRIQNLWSARVNLAKQIRALINKNTDLHLRDEVLPLTKPSCSLVQWTLVDWEEYAANSCTAAYIDANLVDMDHLFYRAVVVRGSAKMECLISVSCKFPTNTPLWIISIHWNGEHNAANNAAIKQMEYWTNSLIQTELRNPLSMLSMQLARTMYSFDIFLETEGPLYSPVEYNREKHYIKAFAKRIRARPYRYIEGGTTNTFKQ